MGSTLTPNPLSFILHPPKGTGNRRARLARKGQGRGSGCGVGVVGLGKDQGPDGKGLGGYQELQKDGGRR